MVETHCWLSTTATGYLDLHMSSPHVIEGEGVEEQCYWEGVPSPGACSVPPPGPSSQGSKGKKTIYRRLSYTVSARTALPR